MAIDFFDNVTAMVKGSQVVNTEGIESANSQLKSVNQNINAAFDDMKKIATKLDSDWNSPAGTTACSNMYQLFKNAEIRSSVVQNYINILEQQVNPGYSSAEEVNTSLADQFR